MLLLITKTTDNPLIPVVISETSCRESVFNGEQGLLKTNKGFVRRSLNSRMTRRARYRLSFGGREAKTPGHVIWVTSFGLR